MMQSPFVPSAGFLYLEESAAFTAQGEGEPVTLLAAVLIEDCVFEGNFAMSGGAIFLTRFNGNTVELRRNTFFNLTAFEGGAIFISEALGDRQTSQARAPSSHTSLFVNSQAGQGRVCECQSASECAKVFRVSNFSKCKNTTP
jgi:hypothetical protein